MVRSLNKILATLRELKLESEGKVRRGTGKPSPAVLGSLPVRPASGADLLKALLDVREEGR